MAKKKLPPLEYIIWANVEKWRMIRGISNEQVCGILGVQRLSDRKAKGYMTTEEMGRICTYFEIEPEKLLER